jgi:hypothetical protein
VIFSIYTSHLLPIGTWCNTTGRSPTSPPGYCRGINTPADCIPTIIEQCANVAGGGGGQDDGSRTTGDANKLDDTKALPLVHIVAHSHNDPGWLKTEEQYYETATKQIITNVVTALEQRKERVFHWVEMVSVSGVSLGGDGVRLEIESCSLFIDRIYFLDYCVVLLTGIFESGG